MKDNKQDTQGKEDDIRSVTERNKPTICQQERQAKESSQQVTSDIKHQEPINNLTDEVHI